MINLTKIKLFFLLVFVFSLNGYAETSFINDLVKDYNGKYISGYLKPLFTSVQQGLNSNLYSNTNYQKDEWSFGLDISANAMMIPNSQLEFDVAVPDSFLGKKIAYTNGSGTEYARVSTTKQPTIFGGKSNPIFITNDVKNTNQVQTYLEGVNLSNVSALPVFQFVVGLPTQTEVRLRGAGGGGASFYSFIVNQRLDEYLEIFGKDNKSHALGVNIGYQSIGFDYDKDVANDYSLNTNIALSTFCFGATYNYMIAEKFNLYAGLQYETISGDMKAMFVDKKVATNSNVIAFDLDSYTNVKVLAGLSYRMGFFEIHGDAAYASQPIFTGGFTFWFGRWGGANETSK